MGLQKDFARLQQFTPQIMGFFGGFVVHEPAEFQIQKLSWTRFGISNLRGGKHDLQFFTNYT